MAVLLGLLVAASFGTDDFLGGLASRRADTLAVLGLVQLTALAGAVLVAPVGGGHLTVRIAALAAGSGLLNAAALGCLYRGLAIGQIGQVAPTAAVMGALLPVAWGLVDGERPSAVALAGVGLAVVAGALVTREREERHGPFVGRALPLALAAGVGFGASFVLFAESSHGSGLWPVLCARGAAVVGVGAAIAVARPERPADTRWPRLAVAAGALDAAGATILLVALRHGLIAVVAPVASLAPGFTVMHAWWYLRERASALQVAGLGVALAGLALIAAG